MSVTFTKLFASITESTVWCEPDSTRIVWITMLAMADSKGRVWASIPGLANRARVTVQQVENALITFKSPDHYSRTPDNEGRRVEDIDGGWRLLNHEKYRGIRDEESIKESKRRYINERRKAEKSVENVEQKILQSNSVELCRYNAEADTEAYTDKTKPKVKSVGASATRLPADWTPSDAEIDYCKTQRPDLIVEKVVENFSDYWHAKGGAAARKVDWSATWRSWVRNEKAVNQRVNGSRNQHEHNASFMSAILSPLNKREIDVTPNVCLIGKS